MRTGLAIAWGVLLLGLAAAHPPPRTNPRELLRLQGHPGT